jgi:hypothetical protein
MGDEIVMIDSQAAKEVDYNHKTTVNKTKQTNL